MKRTLSVILAMLMVVAMCVPALAATSVVPTVTVNATAKVEVDPDIAYISLGVRTENKSSKTAKSENGKIMTKVLAAVYAQGLSKDEVETSGLSMYTTYKWDNNGNRTTTGYVVNNTIRISVKNLDKVGDIVDAAMNAGANQFNNVSFGLEDEEDYYVQALSKATAKAKKRASAIAAANGSTLGDAVSFNNTNVSYNNFIYTDAEEDVVEEAAADGAADSIGSTITSGKITVSATVTAVYSIK